jgi:S-adenosylmethionine synthetase
VWLSYSIGLARPVSVQVETFGTGRRPEAEIVGLLARHFDFRPAAIVRDLGLRRLPSRSPDGFYRSLAAYGHMGRTELDVPWERTDRAAGLRS